MDAYSVYRDIQKRTKGQFLIGVVGPVRTGKSTLIRWHCRIFRKRNRRRYGMPCL